MINSDDELKITLTQDYTKIKDGKNDLIVEVSTNSNTTKKINIKNINMEINTKTDRRVETNNVEKLELTLKFKKNRQNIQNVKMMFAQLSEQINKELDKAVLDNLFNI